MALDADLKPQLVQVTRVGQHFRRSTYTEVFPRVYWTLVQYGRGGGINGKWNNAVREQWNDDQSPIFPHSMTPTFRRHHSIIPTFHAPAAGYLTSVDLVYRP